MSAQSGSVMRTLGQINHVILFIEKTILILLMLGMLVFGFLQVFSRFILKAPIGWSEELLTYSFTWASFIGASMAIYTNSHFSVDIVIKHFPERFLKSIRFFVSLLICIFAAFLLFMGTRLSIANHIQRMNILPISMFWAYLAMPVSGAFILIHGIEKTVEILLDIEPGTMEEYE
ncbi:TRAP transporter small permease [Marispirochaeta sp.]|uniref:TRAP transporter small permease n=1 Tax=Marispirochaeta sp. TaxID=2038653 RepID=UPI0029C6D213|nr:TRAP transporter small permease [Marispirochaeta sp.]